jgi:cyclophilin family peptidyl-prolyl cis-trans isomerase
VSTTPEPRGRGTIAAVTALVLMVAALVALGVGLNRVAGKNSAAGIATPTPAPTPAATPTPSPTPPPTPTPSQVPFADCSKATFGPVLQPLDAPADLHVYKAEPAMTVKPAKLYQVTITTAKGTIVLCLQPTLAPHTVNVVVTLVRNHFYDGLKFHRVVAGFVVQGGDPKGDGTGGPGFSFADEPVHNTYQDGSLAMANSGANTNGSQFFICIDDCTRKLTPNYNLFGHVVEGIEVAQATQVGDKFNKFEVEERDR